MKSRLVMATAAAVFLLSPLRLSHAQAASDFLRVEFLDRVGIGTTTQPFDVRLRITNTGADPFNFDGNDVGGSFGLPADRLPVTGKVNPDDEDEIPQNFGSYTSAFLNVFVECSGNFFSGTPPCPGTPYDFEFNSSPLVFAESFMLAGGGTYDFLLGTLSPAGGTAPPGEYRLFNAGIFFGIQGLAEDNSTVLNASVDVNACFDGGNHPECNFVRTTVEASVIGTVPEPATLAMLGAGFAALVVASRRRRSN